MEKNEKENNTRKKITYSIFRVQKNALQITMLWGQKAFFWNTLQYKQLNSDQNTDVINT